MVTEAVPEEYQHVKQQNKKEKPCSCYRFVEEGERVRGKMPPDVSISFEPLFNAGWRPQSKSVNTVHVKGSTQRICIAALDIRRAKHDIAKRDDRPDSQVRRSEYLRRIDSTAREFQDLVVGRCLRRGINENRIPHYYRSSSSLSG
jgi:hypothetical protein